MNKQQIEEAITSTLVIENKQSIHLAVAKILSLSQPKRFVEIINVSGGGGTNNGNLVANGGGGGSEGKALTK